MARISTHILDISKGAPLAGVHVELYLGGTLVASAITNADGRTDAPLYSGEEIPVGRYELLFYVGSHFETMGVPFFDDIPIRFGVDDAHGHYHVPLLVAPHGYTTYRGS